jgi:glycosyltransferase involved in cell wall biosynthesis
VTGRALRVGLHLERPVPEQGGGFTFTSEVLRALAGLQGETRHALETFGWHDADGWYRQGQPRLPHRRARSAWERGRALEARVRRRVVQALGAGEPDGALGALAREARYDLLWCMEPGSVPTFEVPFVTTVWDLQHRRQPFFPEVSAERAWAARERAYRAALPRAAAVVVGTRVGQEEVTRFFGVADERFVLLPHPTPGFALEAARGGAGGDAAALARHGLAPGYVLYPAQLWPHKNHVGLLRALAALERLGHAPALALPGSDPCGNAAHIDAEARRLGLGARVRRLGFVPQEDLPALYRGALCLAYPTFFGPENLPPLEAFALGCPVVASRVPGAVEQLGDAALLGDPAVPDELARAIARVAAEPGLREALVARGRARAARFTPADFARGLLAFVDRFEAVRACWG